MFFVHSSLQQVVSPIDKFFAQKLLVSEWEVSIRNHLPSFPEFSRPDGSCIFD
jgi:hypothetical protein